MRQNMAAHWFPTNGSSEFFGPLYARFKHLLPASVDGRPLYECLNEELAVFKYAEKDQFMPHTDGMFPASAASADGEGVDTWDGVQSGLSMLLYLNDGVTGEYVGGETRLFRLGTSPRDNQFVDIAPKKGSALFFRHGSGPDSVLHAGLPVDVGSKGSKCLVKMNVLYGVRT